MRSVLKEELCLRNFGLGFHLPEAFCQAQWRWPPAVFVLYRTLMAGYSIYVFTDLAVDTANADNDPRNIMVWLTNWTYLALTVFFLAGLLLAVLHVVRPRLINPQSGFDPRAAGGEQMNLRAQLGAKGGSDGGGLHNAGYSGDLNSDGGGSGATRKCADGRGSPADPEARLGECLAPPPDTPWFVRYYWVLSNVVQTFPFIVTVIYFSALYNPAAGLSRLDFNLHGVNSIMVLIDLALCARPVRLLHLVYPTVYGLVYVVFSAIYWSLDKRNNVLYQNVLDWNKPGQTIGVVLSLTVVGLPLLQLANFGLFKLRLLLFQKIYGDRYL